MSLPDDDLPPPPPPSRDPLLDDAVFAEIVGPEPGRPVPKPLDAEPVEAPAASDLPVAELAAVQPAAEALPVARLKAQPVRAPIPTIKAGAFPGPAIDTPPPKPHWFAACAVIGCLGIAIIGAIAVLAWIAITLLSEFGNKLKDQKSNGAQPINYPARPGPIAPTALVNDRTLVLAGTVDAVGHGGSGRYLVLRIPRVQELHVFDVNQAEIVHRIPLAEKKSLFAASDSKLFAYHPGAGKLERFDLLTGKSEQEVVRPAGVSLVDALAIGPGTGGSLSLITAPPGNPAKIQPIDVATLNPGTAYDVKGWLGRKDRQVNARSSFDGMMLGVSGANGALAIRIDDAGARAIPLVPKIGQPPLLATPSPDGQYLYTSRGVFDADGRHLVGKGSDPFFAFPTAHGSGLFLSLNVDAGRVEGVPRLHAAGSESTNELIALGRGDVSGDLPANELRENSVPADERVQLWPGAGLLAVLPLPERGVQQLQMFKVDVGQELSASRRSFLVFSSEPPVIARRGLVWGYKPQFWSGSKSEPKLRVDGLPGASVRGDRIDWTPPGIEGPVDATIEAELPSGRKATQRFRIWVTN